MNEFMTKVEQNRLSVFLFTAADGNLAQYSVAVGFGNPGTIFGAIAISFADGSLFRWRNGNASFTRIG